MTLLISCLLGFAVLHLLPALPSHKAAAQRLLGRLYGPLYGIAMLALLLGAIGAMRYAERIELYEPPSWGWHANMIISFVAFLFVGIFLFRGSWRNRLRFPLAIGIWLWALGHLLANGDAATVVFAGGLAVASLLFVLVKVTQTGFQPSEERQGHNSLSLLAGVALYALMTQLHVVLAGVPLVTLK